MTENAEANGPNPSPGTSTDNELEDLQSLNFPGDVDWSSTLVLRCDPKGGPYNINDVMKGLHEVVRRNKVFNLGPTFLNHVFTISFKSKFDMDSFLIYLKRSNSSKSLKVKGHACTLTKVPSKCVNVYVRNIPLEIDTAHIVNELKKYGNIVKTVWVKSNFRGWFHVYTNERKFTINLHDDVNVQDLPYSIGIKGLVGAVKVEERNPKCLECYYSGHKSDVCELKGCLLNQNTN